MDTICISSQASWHVIRNVICVHRVKQQPWRSHAWPVIGSNLHLHWRSNIKDAILNFLFLDWVLTTPCYHFSPYCQIRFLEMWPLTTYTCYQKQYQNPNQVLLQRHSLHLQNKIEYNKLYGLGWNAKYLIYVTGYNKLWT